MLILSRRAKETVVFPHLDIEVTICRVAGKVVHVGIKAPQEIDVLRGELVEEEPASTPSSAGGEPAVVDAKPVRNDSREEPASFDRHALRNSVNKAMLGLQVLQAHLESGSTSEAESFVDKSLASLGQLNQLLETLPASARFATRQATPSITSDQVVALSALIVDDSQNEAGLLAQFLELKGCTAHVVHNGLQAIDWLEQHEHPDVVLMDMQMPEMDGPTAVRRIRRDHRFDDVQLVGVSGYRQHEVGLQHRWLGVDAWFEKPVNAEQLVNLIRERHRRIEANELQWRQQDSPQSMHSSAVD